MNSIKIALMSATSWTIEKQLDGLAISRWPIGRSRHMYRVGQKKLDCFLRVDNFATVRLRKV